jgi:hypothetical protein|tara:strand:+ start:3245 stop:3448 length:204 start_codon:yes stop_codon:yes gene_type:complete
LANKIYHIYAKGECLYNNLNEEQFHQTWSQLQGMVGLMRTDYSKEDLSYEQVYTLMESGSPAGSDSY